LLAFVSASNELPEPESHLAAMWSRMTIRVQVNSLDRGGKKKLVDARLSRDRGSRITSPAWLTLAEVELLREARPHVEVPDDIVELTLAIYQELLDADAAGLDWLWKDDRRFGRVFDVMQASALLDGRTQVGKADLRALEWMLWDTPEQIPVVAAKIAPHVRTPLSDAKEQIDALFALGGMVAAVEGGDRNRLVPALTQFEQVEQELAKLEGGASGNEKTAIGDLRKEIAGKKAAFVAQATGVRR
jgi:MoxR-like ATPase